MTATVLICAVSCALMIAAILFFPKFHIFRIPVSTYWVVALAGALCLLLTGQVGFSEAFGAMTASGAMNPIKILVLFLSMTVLSIFLDELNFFRYLANATLSRAGKSQMRLFLSLYLTVSVLTVFTSNDIIILSFTPFICYFAECAHISPVPYLAAEFVAANTWSMALIIGNPTNIYIAAANGVGFLEYTGKMILPTLAAGAVAFFALWLLFRKKLSEPMSAEPVKTRIVDRTGLVIGIVHLAGCTVALAVSSYIPGVAMWAIALGAVCSLFVCTLLAALIRRRPPRELLHCLYRAPWELVPFVLSMFVLIVALSGAGVTGGIADLLGERAPVWKYGVVSFFSANIVNNIPMSVLFCKVIESVPAAAKQAAVYATVAGSNLGALFSPVGALAGIMWSSMLTERNVKFTVKDFLKMGVTVALPALAVTLLSLRLILG